MHALKRSKIPRSSAAPQTHKTVAFENVQKGPPDPMQDLKKATDADNSPTKVDIGAGVYRSTDGQYHEFNAIRRAKRQLDSLNFGHDYNPTTGIPSFTQRAAKLLSGKHALALRDERVASVQTVGGTGANRIGAAFLRRNWFNANDAPCAYLGEPAWGNYRPLLENAGFHVRLYEHSRRGDTQPNHEAIMMAIAKAPSRSVFILQASCHNPTGLDYDRTQWQAIAKAMLHSQHFAFFDAAYLEFGSEKSDAADDDAWALRHFVELGVDTLICQSFSKTFGLYAERVGALHVICQTKSIAENVFDQLRAQIRWEVSSSPAYGARLIDIILADEELHHNWLAKLNQAAARIVYNRQVLHGLLKQNLKTPGSRIHVMKEKGLFSYLQLTPADIQKLTADHHVYLPPNGRINMAGLNQTNIEYVAKAIDSVIRSK